MSAEGNFQQACFWGLKTKHFWLRGCGPSLYIYIYICTYVSITEFTRESPSSPHLQQTVVGKSNLPTLPPLEVTVIRKGQTECFECQAKPSQKAVYFPDSRVTSIPSEPRTKTWLVGLYRG